MSIASKPEPPPTGSSLARHQCAQLLADTEALANGQLTVALFCERARGHAALREALPAAFDPVLMGLLDRLESAALFTEESCSFSQRDLIDSLRLWQRKAAARLAV